MILYLKFYSNNRKENDKQNKVNYYFLYFIMTRNETQAASSFRVEERILFPLKFISMNGNI